MPRWFADYLPCAPLNQWFSRWSDGHRLQRVGAKRWPGDLERWLANVPFATSGPALLMHAADLRRQPDGDVRQAMYDTGPARVVDIAWIGLTHGFGPRFWRTEASMEATAGRLEFWLDAGLVDLQQWVCDEPVAAVVTLGAACR